VGAGDAMFAVTSMCVYQKAPMPVVGLVGNAVGAQAVGIVGNRSAIDRVLLERHLQHLLK
jgi:sugar/nucleoside kinase (ribokinase family)